MGMRYNLIIKTLLVVVFCLCVICIISCSTKGDSVKLSDPDTEFLCRLDQADIPIDKLYSMAITGDRRVIVSTLKEVLAYSFDGKYIGRIGNHGRAAGEYSMPMVVRTDEKHIYVWDAMNLKFIVYNIDGTFKSEYPYPSALRDFIPYGDKLAIYTAGNRQDNIIDIYSLEGKSVVDSFTPASPSQRAFRLISGYPMSISGDELFYMPSCELKLYKHNLKDEGGEELAGDFISDSFFVPQIEDAKALSSNKKERSSFHDKTSSVRMVIPYNQRILIMTLEGSFYSQDDVQKTDKRFYSFYLVDGGKLKCLACFPYDKLAASSLLCYSDGRLYFLKKEIDDKCGEESLQLFDYDIKKLFKR